MCQENPASTHQTLPSCVSVHKSHQCTERQDKCFMFIRKRRAVRHLCPHPSRIPPTPISHSAMPLTSFPVQHDSKSVPCGKPKGFGEMLQDHAGNISGGLGLGRKPAWGNGRHKPYPQLTTCSVGHHHRMPISSIHWACTRTELEEFQTQMNPIQN